MAQRRSLPPQCAAQPEEGIVSIISSDPGHIQWHMCLRRLQPAMPVYATLARWASGRIPKAMPHLQARMLMSSWEKIEATLFQAIIDCFTLELSDISGLGGRRRRRGRRGRRARRRRGSRSGGGTSNLTTPSFIPIPTPHSHSNLQHPPIIHPQLRTLPASTSSTYCCT